MVKVEFMEGCAARMEKFLYCSARNCGRQLASHGDPGGAVGNELDERARGIPRCNGPIYVRCIPWRVTSGEKERCFRVVVKVFQRPESQTLSSVVSWYGNV